jgi:pimeloyl-ACP methyl ester carboxylesterase
MSGVDWVLVHGGLCGAWCWARLEPELARLGHRTHTLDLPIGDPEAGLDDYADVVVEAMASLERPWLVGHSMGGLVVPRAALRRPVGGLVFLCAGFPPTSEVEFEEDLAARDPRNASHFIHDGEGRITLSFDDAVHDFFHDCPEEIQRWAFARMRPQATGPFEGYAPIERYPDVPMNAIVATDDRIVLREPHRTLIRRRIGVEPEELPGGHCPFLSRPRPLAERLHEMLGMA